MTALADSLDRTLLLIRDEVGPDIDDCILLDALTTTSVALIADAANIASHPAQTTFVTCAMLMARSGHNVFLSAPELAMVAPQPPLQSGNIISQLLNVGADMLPGVEFVEGMPDGEVDLAIALGDSPIDVRARRRIRLNAEAWTGFITREDMPRRWHDGLWPLGALAAAGLGAGEAFKMAMYKLLPYALDPQNTAARFAYTDEATCELAPPDTPFCRDLGRIDCVSGGAITNAVLYCLARIPAVTATGRIIEPDTAEVTNLNRYMLLLRSALETRKAHDLVSMLGNGFRLHPVLEHYDVETASRILPFAPTVVVGVDHIPTRWTVQDAMPEWLVIGATSHWSAMASFHSEGLGCARCLHDRDEPDNAPIPTTAFVSFWAGLLVSAYLARHAVGQSIPANEQQVYVTPFRSENAFSAGVPPRKDCPTCQGRLRAGSGDTVA